MNDTCRMFRKQIPPALLGQLEEDSFREWSTHRGSCPACEQENRAMSGLFGQLGPQADVTPPRHFLLRESTPALFSKLRPSPLWNRSFWAWAPAAALLVLCFGWLGKQWTSPSAPPPPALTQADLESFRQSLFRSLEEKTKSEKAEWLIVLHKELADFSQTLDDRRRRQLQIAMTRMEEDLGRRLLTFEIRQRLENDRATTQVVEWLQSQQISLRQLSEQINQVAYRDRQRGKETDRLFASLIEAQAGQWTGNPLNK